MTQNDHLALIARLQERTHACISEYIDTSAPLAIVDFPDIKNCGDSAIWLGEMAYLRDRFNKRPSYVSRMRDFSAAALARKVPEGPIFIHGGGNFGDIWPAHQDFRELVLEKFIGREVIQFPQSIHFQSNDRLEQAKRRIDRHGKFVLLVRDERSRQFAERHFNCTVRLCPDMAFCIGPTLSTKAAIPVLAMLRQDKERKAHDKALFPCDLPTEDWITESSLQVRLAKLAGGISALRENARHEFRLRLLDAAANNRFRRGIQQISRGKAIVTDRLHVHICSLLIGRPHAVLDNSYGKLGGFMDAFSGGTTLSHKATSLQEAVTWAALRAAQVTAEATPNE